ncbi:hypothetical protein [Vreelandella venusta]|nr:hypothetical protein [Halomonas venusta]MDX1712721.1 hypothetical protein [Halomonas venusta]
MVGANGREQGNAFAKQGREALTWQGNKVVNGEVIRGEAVRCA